MLPRSLQGRLLLTFVTLMALGLGSVILLGGWRLTAQNLNRSQQNLELQGQIIANALREPIERGSTGPAGGRSLDTLIASYAQGIAGRVTLVDPQLKVVVSSDLAVPAQSTESRSELIAASNGTPQSTIRWDEWSKEERLFVAAPIVGDRGQALGFVQLSIPTAPIYAQLQETWLSFLVIGAVVLLVTILASALLARQIAIPVQSLTTTSEQIAAGRLDERVTPAGPSETRRLGHAFNRMADQVQEMIGQQRVFVDNAAHELRSPLTSLRLRLEMLQAHGQSDGELTQRYLGQMEREVGYLQRLTDQLLALASVDGGDSAPRSSLDLSRLLYDLTDQVGALAQQAELNLQVDVPDHLPRVEANPEQMSMLVRNLLDNAIKYTRSGGTITLTAQQADDRVVIRVADTGMGIPAEALPHIFDRFYRADRARSRRPSPGAAGGAGLGLSLVREIAEAHGGRVEVESRVNVGSTFTVSLPIDYAVNPSGD